MRLSPHTLLLLASYGDSPSYRAWWELSDGDHEIWTMKGYLFTR